MNPSTSSSSESDDEGAMMVGDKFEWKKVQTEDLYLYYQDAYIPTMGFEDMFFDF
jgi:hypothetical protein